MPMTDTLKSKLGRLLMENTDAALIGDATGLRGSTTAGSWYLSLHTANPGASGNQTTNETGYTGYARIAVPRNDANWSELAGVFSNLIEQVFGENTGSSTDITHVGVGTSLTGTGSLELIGVLPETKTINNGVSPKFLVGEFSVTLT